MSPTRVRTLPAVARFQDQASSFGIWAFWGDFGIWISGFRSQISGVGLRVVGFGVRVSGFGFTGWGARDKTRVSLECPESCLHWLAGVADWNLNWEIRGRKGGSIFGF